MKRLFAHFLVIWLGVAAPGAAAAQDISLIRDAEIERTLHTYLAPIAQSAGISPSALKLYLVNDNTLNAFVIPGNRMFLHTGLLIRSERPDQVIGVMAHEMGHIRGGHYLGRAEQFKDAYFTALATFLLGVAAAVATGTPELGAAGSIAGQELAVRNLLSYTQSQERAADQAAVQLMRASGHSPAGLVEFFKILSAEQDILATNQDPYLRTHPLTSERIDYLTNALEESPYYGRRADAELQAEHDRMRAKLIGFLLPRQVDHYYPENDQSVPARYARSIAHYRAARIDDALALLDSLIDERPNDPYFHELKGQILLDHQRIDAALQSYQRAADLLPDEPQIRYALAETQLARNDPAQAQAALDNLQVVLSEEPNMSRAWRLSAKAHNLLGDEGMRTLADAEYSYASGDFRRAIGLAKHAQTLLDRGTPAYVRAVDLESIAEYSYAQQRERRN